MPYFGRKQIPSGDTLKLAKGSTINEFSTDGTLLGDSASAVPTKKAIKDYLDDNLITPDYLKLASDTGILGGLVRSTSEQPIFVRPQGAANTVVVMTNTTPLKTLIDNTTVVFSGTDTAITGLTTAPATNNTFLIDMASLIGDDNSKKVTEITIDNIDTNVLPFNNQLIAFKPTLGNEIILGYLDTANNRVLDLKRQYFFDSLNAPILADTFSDNDSMTILQLVWIYAKNDLTYFVKYKTPFYQYNTPGGAVTGDMWYDIQAKTWKTYNGITWVVSNSLPIGFAVVDPTICIAARSYDFQSYIISYNNIALEKVSDSVIRTKTFNNVVTVFHKKLEIYEEYLYWDLTTDLETGFVEAPSTTYYVYVGSKAELVLSPISPIYQSNINIFRHPHNYWRCIGEAFNDEDSNILSPFDFNGSKQTEPLIYSNPGSHTFMKPVTLDSARIRTTVVAGGASGGANVTNNGLSGQSSSFSTLVSATGGILGVKGTTGTGGTGGAGGTGTGGDNNYTGVAGTAGSSSTQYYQSPLQTITSAGSLVLAHGFGTVPTMVQCFLQNTTAEGGYSIGDIIPINNAENASGANNSKGVSVTLTSVNVLIRYGSLASAFSIINKTTGVDFQIVNANWRLVVRAWTGNPSFKTEDLEINPQQFLVIPHKLPFAPHLVQCRLKCINAQNGYLAGDEVIVNNYANAVAGNDDKSVSIKFDTENLYLKFGLAAAGFDIINKTTGVGATITNTNWSYVIYAWSDLDFFESANQTITAAGSLTIPHGLGTTPVLFIPKLVNVTAELGFQPGDELYIDNNLMCDAAVVNMGQSITYDSTNIHIRYGSNANVYSVVRTSDGETTLITLANWRFRIVAFESTVDLARISGGEGGDCGQFIPIGKKKEETETFFESSNINVIAGNLISVTHSLGDTPTLVQFILKNTTPELGYTLGDEVFIDASIASAASNTDKGITCKANETDLHIFFGSNASTFDVINKTTGATAAATNANWKLIVRAWTGGPDFESDPLTIAATNNYLLLHRLLVNPALIRCKIRCINSEFGFLPGDTIFIDNLDASSGASAGRGLRILSDQDQIDVLIANTNPCFFVTDFQGGDTQILTNANWELIIMAWKELTHSTAPEQPIVSASSLVIPHTLGVNPKLVQCRLKCITAEFGYVAGDELYIDNNLSGDSTNTNKGLIITTTSSVINVKLGSNASVFEIFNKTTGASATITNARWQLIITVFPTVIGLTAKDGILPGLKSIPGEDGKKFGGGGSGQNWLQTTQPVAGANGGGGGGAGAADKILNINDDSIYSITVGDGGAAVAGSENLSGSGFPGVVVIEYI